MEHTFTSENFQAEVLDSATPVLVDCWAEWCPPCRAMGPVIEELANEIDGSTVKIGKLNVDQHGDISGRYNVMSIPTFLIFKNGQVIGQLLGAMPKETFKAELLKKLGA